jgi:hypothetical protein
MFEKLTRIINIFNKVKTEKFIILFFSITSIFESITEIEVNNTIELKISIA